MPVRARTLALCIHIKHKHTTTTKNQQKQRKLRRNSTIFNYTVHIDQIIRYVTQIKW